MELTAGTEIEAPIDHVFARISDPETLERSLRQRGAEVRRLDGGSGLSEGACWEVTFRFRGKDRCVTAEVADLRAPGGYRIDSGAGGLTGRTSITLEPLGPERTRLDLHQDFASTTLSSRLLLQSLRLARHTLEERLDKRLREEGARIEADYRRA